MIARIADDEMFQSWRETRRTHKVALSSSVHVSDYSTSFTALVPSLRTPGMWALTPFGHHSEMAPQLLDMLTKEVYLVTNVVIRMMTSDSAPPIFSSPEADEQRLDTFLVSALTLQDLVVRHWEDISHLHQTAIDPTDCT